MSYRYTHFTFGKPSEATLTFLRSELLTDIAQIGFVEGDVMQAAEERDRHQVMDITQSGNVDRVTRMLALALDECRELLYPYAKEAVEPMEMRDDVLEEKEAYVIKMGIDTEWSATTISLLEKLIHEYLICRVLYDWFSITKPTSAPSWAEKAERARMGIMSAINYRRGKMRRQIRPF